MKKTLFLLLCGLSGLAPGASYVPSEDDLDGLGAMVAPDVYMNRSLFARGYVTGVADATVGSAWCANPQATNERMYQVVTQFMKVHPESVSWGASKIVVDVLAREFPCEKK